MLIFRRIAKPVSHFVLTGFLALALHIPAVNAGLISTDVVVDVKQQQQLRERLHQALTRDDVKRQLQERGVNPVQIQDRVNNLTDQEVQQLAAKMDEMPTGGDAFSVAVFVFLILLLTDILGYTDIFPFVKKTAQ